MQIKVILSEILEVFFSRLSWDSAFFIGRGRVGFRAKVLGYLDIRLWRQGIERGLARDPSHRSHIENPTMGTEMKE